MASSSAGLRGAKPENDMIQPRASRDHCIGFAHFFSRLNGAKHSPSFPAPGCNMSSGVGANFVGLRDAHDHVGHQDQDRMVTPGEFPVSFYSIFDTRASLL